MTERDFDYGDSWQRIEDIIAEHEEDEIFEKPKVVKKDIEVLVDRKTKNQLKHGKKA